MATILKERELLISNRKGGNEKPLHYLSQDKLVNQITNKKNNCDMIAYVQKDMAIMGKKTSQVYASHFIFLRKENNSLEDFRK